MSIALQELSISFSLALDSSGSSSSSGSVSVVLSLSSLSEESCPLSSAYLKMPGPISSTIKPLAFASLLAWRYILK